MMLVRRGSCVHLLFRVVGHDRYAGLVEAGLQEGQVRLRSVDELPPRGPPLHPAPAPRGDRVASSKLDDLPIAVDQKRSGAHIFSLM